MNTDTPNANPPTTVKAELNGLLNSLLTDNVILMSTGVDAASDAQRDTRIAIHALFERSHKEFVTVLSGFIGLLERDDWVERSDHPDNASELLQQARALVAQHHTTT